MNRREFVKLAPAFPAAAVTASLTVREEGKAPVELDVSVLKCQPGDTLVLRANGRLHMEDRECIQQHFEHIFPGLKAIVLNDGMTLDGVIRA